MREVTIGSWSYFIEHWLQKVIASHSMELTRLTSKIPWDQNLVDCCLGSLCEENFFFSIFSFRRVNYIFCNLSVNTKHAQFRLRMNSWRILLKMGIKLILTVFSKELLHAAMWLKLPQVRTIYKQVEVPNYLVRVNKVN